MIAPYPTASDAMRYPTEEAEMDRVIAVIRGIRNRRAERNVPPSRRTKLFIVTKYPETFRKAEAYLAKLASASEIELVDAYSAEGAVSIVTDAATVYIPLSDLVDVEKEKARLSAELAKIEGEIKRVAGKLANEGFTAKAPAAVVDAERAKLEKYKATEAALRETLSGLSK
jgi:valyl-tRNA synthetase